MFSGGGFVRLSCGFWNDDSDQPTQRNHKKSSQHSIGWCWCDTPGPLWLVVSWNHMRSLIETTVSRICFQPTPQRELHNFSHTCSQNRRVFGCSCLCVFFYFLHGTGEGWGSVCLLGWWGGVMPFSEISTCPLQVFQYLDSRFKIFKN